MFVDFKKLFSSEYLINIDAAMLHRTDKTLLIFGAVLVIAGIIFRLTSIFAPHAFAQRLWARLSAWALTIGVLEVLWFGLRYERTIYLGSHLLAFIIAAIGIVWVIPILRYWFGQYRRDVAQWHKDQLKQKYLQPQK